MGHAGRGKSTAQVEEDSFCTYSLSSSFGCEYAKSHVKQPQDTLYDDLQGASAETQDGGKRGPKKKHGLKTRRRSTTSFLCSNTFGAIGTQTHLTVASFLKPASRRKEKKRKRPPGQA